MKRILMLAALCAAMPLCAATLTVTNLSDSGAGSLRQTCIDAVTGDTIVFQPGLAGGITFASEINLGAKALTITGNADALGAATVTLDGNAATRLLSTGAAISLDTLALYQGYAIGAEGGAINSTSNVTCTACTFLADYATSQGGAICCNGGGVTCTGCTFEANFINTGFGGAIYCILGDVVCTDCLFSQNIIYSSGDGGAIYQVGFGHTVTCTDCTFYSNLAINDYTTPTVGNGGAIYCNGDGITCTGCTFYANIALKEGGAIYAQVYGITCTDCTFSTNNGIGRCIRTSSAQVTITNCIVADQYAGSMFAGLFATFTSGGHNICTAAAADVPWMNATGDQMGTDPMLGPLQDNGGPVPTMRPLIGSPAIDKGGGSVTTTDARGFTRPADDAAIANATGGDGRDIGAVEFELPDITLLRDGVVITDGGGDNTFGAAGTAISRVFTIRNDGFALLNIGAITFSNQSNCNVAMTAAPSASLAHAASTTFAIEITPTAEGPFSFDMQIASDDPGENPYDAHIVGAAPRGSGGGDGGDDEGCTTGTRRGVPVMFALALLLFVAARRRHDARS
ncbi:MAG: hypothetical protein IPP14_09010 [Planctomycetes bacterium]|nr:hypothetical protein [Planctomycetota bacterium]